jgi:hypothetical protein
MRLIRLVQRLWATRSLGVPLGKRIERLWPSTGVEYMSVFDVTRTAMVDPVPPERPDDPKESMGPRNTKNPGDQEKRGPG